MVILRVLSYSLVGYIYVTVFGGFHILHEDVSVKPSLCDHLLGPQPETGFVYNYRVVCMVPHTIPYTVYQVHGVVSHSQVYMVPYTIATSMDHTCTYTSRQEKGRKYIKKNDIEKTAKLDNTKPVRTYQVCFELYECSYARRTFLPCLTV